MTDIASSPTPATSLPELSGRMADDLAHLDAELAEVDLLVVQAKTEAARHESRRVAASEKLATAISTATSSGAPLDPTVSADLNAQLVLLTKRAALMELQVDVLEGKRRALGRYRDALAAYAESLSPFQDVPIPAARPAKIGAGGPRTADTSGVPPAVSRLLLDAQEDLRREIARAMHDGPAQSLTNIVLQAQIVERLVATRPGQGRQRGPPADRDGPADARGDQVVHLRRPADGPRRPRAGAHPPSRGARARPACGRAGRVRHARAGAAAADGPRERPVPHPRRGDVRLPVRTGRAGLDPARLGRAAGGARRGLAGRRRDTAGPDPGGRPPTRTCRPPSPR